MSTPQAQQTKSLAEFWTDFLKAEFSKETDRAAIILAASLFENALTNILKKYLAPTAGVDDELLDGSLAPLSSFSAKIQMAQRLGLISIRFARDLNLVRKIRNEFAHNVHGSTLESGKIKDYLTNLTRGSGIVQGHKGLQSLYPAGSRGEFLMFANVALFHLHSLVDGNLPTSAPQTLQDEWFYSWTYKPPAVQVPAPSAPITT